MPTSRCPPPRSTRAFSVVETDEHELVRLARRIDDVEDRRAIEQTKLRQRTALRQALEPRLLRLAAGIDAARDIALTPEREQLVERIVGVGLARVLP